MTIYCVTKNKKEDTTLYRSLYENKLKIKYVFKENNTESLTKCYNIFLDMFRHSSDSYALFVHDDVYINCRDLNSRMALYEKNFQVFGVAGATTCKKTRPCLWHIMSEKKDQRGCVAHGDNKQYFYTSFGPLPSRVLLIDGVVIGFTKNIPKELRFDENIPSKFHFYDLDFSLQCNKQKVKVGVVDIPIIHQSPGLREFNKEFALGEDYFYNKWFN